MISYNYDPQRFKSRSMFVVDLFGNFESEKNESAS